MCPLCLHISIIQYNDLIRSDHGMQPMRDDQYCLSPDHLRYCGIHLFFVFRIDKGSSLIKNDARRERIA